LELSSVQAVAAIRSGRVPAQTYMRTLIAIALAFEAVLGSLPAPTPMSIDEPVGAHHDRLRHIQPERLGRPQADRQRDPSRLLDRKAARIGALEYLSTNTATSR